MRPEVAVVAVAELAKRPSLGPAKRARPALCADCSPAVGAVGAAGAAGAVRVAGPLVFPSRVFVRCAFRLTDCVSSRRTRSK